jgi:hypothetical protein
MIYFFLERKEHMKNSIADFVYLQYLCHQKPNLSHAAIYLSISIVHRDRSC